jgi:hypothetical protein
MTNEERQNIRHIQQQVARIELQLAEITRQLDQAATEWPYPPQPQDYLPDQQHNKQR